MRHAPRTEIRAVRIPAPPAPADFRPPPPVVIAERRLLLQEIQQLEALLRRTPPRSADRATLIRRLAEDYAELARRSEVERLRSELSLEQPGRPAVPRAPARPNPAP